MATRPILVDTTRLLTRLKHPAPTGIDRVDLAYARHFLRGQAEARAVAITSFGARLLPGRSLERLFDAIEARWIGGDGPDPGGDAILARLAPRLGLPAPQGDPARVDRPRDGGRRPLPDLLRQILRPAHGVHWRPASAAPRQAVYLHTSHIRLDRPALFEWLAARPDIRPVFFVHDLIPIEYPEYGVPGEDARHRVRMRSVARHAAAVIVSSFDVKTRLEAYLAAERLRVPSVTVAPIGVEPNFVPAGARPAGARPYFVACSTIEARKNHLTLLLAWRELAARLGPETPTLVIVGRRGWESENVVDLLDRSPAIRAHVIEAAGLSTPGLVTLLRGARALLMPSFAEGYGIPVVEALALGTPVIASDLPVHREIAGNHATFIHPLDGLGWRDAIAAAASQPAGNGPTGYVPPRWAPHFHTVEKLLRAL